MTDNLKLWNKHPNIDPDYTKPITGRPYKGTSPNPQYVIRCLTDMFGPVGQGFGWDVVAEDFTPLGGETLHWCRIKFWHTDRANTFDSYGQTKASYTTGSGKFMVDEDAPKKSLTDAIIKAASHIGVGANIFLGRWDDQKYVAQVTKEFQEAKTPEVTPAEIDNALQYIKEADDLDDLRRVFGNLPPHIRKVPEVEKAGKEMADWFKKAPETQEAAE